MASLPYITATGRIGDALSAIRTAATPPRISQDFVKSVLRIPGGSGNQITSFLKKIGFADANGEPTETYVRFRNPATSGAAVASAIRHAYAPLYARNEYAHALGEQELRGLVLQETGEAADSNVATLIVKSFMELNRHADWAQPATLGVSKIPSAASAEPEPGARNRPPSGEGSRRDLTLALGYTINLVLPATQDIAVFSAIFRSLKEHLLVSAQDDA